MSSAIKCPHCGERLGKHTIVCANCQNCLTELPPSTESIPHQLLIQSRTVRKEPVAALDAATAYLARFPDGPAAKDMRAVIAATRAVVAVADALDNRLAQIGTEDYEVTPLLARLFHEHLSDVLANGLVTSSRIAPQVK